VAMWMMAQCAEVTYLSYIHIPIYIYIYICIHVYVHWLKRNLTTKNAWGGELFYQPMLKGPAHATSMVIDCARAGAKTSHCET